MADVPLQGGHRGTTVDLSGTGIYFQTDRPFAVDERICLVLRLTHAASCLTAVSCDARVVRVDRIGDQFRIAATYTPVGFDVEEPASHRRAHDSQAEV